MPSDGRASHLPRSVDPAPPRIAIVRQRYNPFGGAERFVERALTAFGEESVALTVIARDWSGARGDTRWLRCDPFHLGRTWRDASFRGAVCRLVAGERFDLVQSHERIDCCDVYRAGDGVHAQWLVNRARAASPWATWLTKCHPYHRYVLAAERRTFASPRLKAVICNSRMVREEIRRWFGAEESKLPVIYNGVDLDHFHPGLREQHRVRVLGEFQIPPAARIVAFVGSGFERKGLPQLIRAMAQLDAADHLIVVGEDRSARRLKCIAQSLGLAQRIHWAGPQRDVRPWYAAADVFALPTLYDPFPNAGLEALACGLPVVTTMSCGLAEIIQDAKNGHVCTDPLDIAQLAEMLRRSLNEGERMRVSARASAEPFSMARTARELMQLYRRLLVR